MCGIAGVLAPEPGLLPTGLAGRMAARLAHRGPDGAGEVASGPCALAHRRLAIVDVSPAAAQPIAGEDGTVLLAANAEIYDHAELRRGLEARGHRFRSRSDCEVVLHLYEERGEEALSAIGGMFALALWDARRGRLILARDRLGKKPLFWARVRAPGGERVVFASEVPALLEDPDLPRTLDREALWDFLSLNYVLAPATLLASVRQLPPGHVAVCEPGREPAVRPYWTLPAPEPRDGAGTARVATFVGEFRTRFRGAVEKRLMSDVPWGVFVSGGLDSAAVLAEARAIAGPVPAFACGIAGATAHDSHDERPAARAVARALGVPLREVEVGPEVLRRIPAVARAAAEPTADSSSLAVHALSERAAGEVKMVLSGDGADEALAGYSTYPASLLARLYRRVPAPVRRAVAPLVRAVRPRGGKLGLAEKARRFVAGVEVPGEGSHFAWRAIFSDEEKARLVRAGARPDGRDTFRALGEAMAACPSRDPLTRLLWGDLRHYLPNDMLVKMDRMGMAHGLEVRTPYLDHALVEWVMGVPPRLKLGRGWRGKELLRRAFSGRLPASTLRRKKAGFSLPLARWFREGEGRRIATEGLDPARVARTGVLDAAGVSHLLASHLRRGSRADESHKIYGLLVLLEWWELVRPT
ncbi:MAG: asparagine synthase (glutamine-hydrolyzing) [Planctomycetales bacterium]|nr:asparagine synthase (glutamine-hydrolyzing) [Planctomycetales bacterium]